MLAAGGGGGAFLQGPARLMLAGGVAALVLVPTGALAAWLVDEHRAEQTRHTATRAQVIERRARELAAQPPTPQEQQEQQHDKTG
jgi:hypothetical protein